MEGFFSPLAMIVHKLLYMNGGEKLLTEKIITANYGDDTVSIIDNIEPLKIHTINLRDLVLSSNCDFDMQVKKIKLDLHHY